MKGGFRIALLAALGGHLALFGSVGALYRPLFVSDHGPSLFAAKLFVEEDEEPSPPKPPPVRVREEREEWTPRETVTAPSRLPAAAPAAGRAPTLAARPELPPRTPAAPAPRSAPAPLALEAQSAGDAALAPSSVGEARIDENVGAADSLSPRERGGGRAPEGGATAGSGSPHPTLSQRERGERAGEKGEGEKAKGEGSAGRVTPAVLLSRPAGVYPRYCRVHGEEGTVVLDVEVGADGTATAPTIVTSSGNARLDKAAVEALCKSTFAPARRGGLPVASVRRIHWVWRLVDADDDQGG